MICVPARVDKRDVGACGDLAAQIAASELRLPCFAGLTRVRRADVIREAMRRGLTQLQRDVDRASQAKSGAVA